MVYQTPVRPDELYHFGVLGMKWGVRRYQNPDGSYTSAGRAHYGFGRRRSGSGGSGSVSRRKGKRSSAASAERRKKIARRALLAAGAVGATAAGIYLVKSGKGKQLAQLASNTLRNRARLSGPATTALKTAGKRSAKDIATSAAKAARRGYVGAVNSAGYNARKAGAAASAVGAKVSRAGKIVGRAGSRGVTAARFTAGEAARSAASSVKRGASAVGSRVKNVAGRARTYATAPRLSGPATTALTTGKRSAKDIATSAAKAARRGYVGAVNSVGYNARKVGAAAKAGASAVGEKASRVGKIAGRAGRRGVTAARFTAGEAARSAASSVKRGASVVGEKASRAANVAGRAGRRGATAARFTAGEAARSAASSVKRGASVVGEKASRAANVAGRAGRRGVTAARFTAGEAARSAAKSVKGAPDAVRKAARKARGLSNSTAVGMPRTALRKAGTAVGAERLNTVRVDRRPVEAAVLGGSAAALAGGVRAKGASKKLTVRAKGASKKLTVRASDSATTKRVKQDFNRMSDQEFRAKYQVSKDRYAYRVEKYGDPYMNSPLAKVGKALAKRKRR